MHSRRGNLNSFLAIFLVFALLGSVATADLAADVAALRNQVTRLNNLRIEDQAKIRDLYVDMNDAKRHIASLQTRWREANTQVIVLSNRLDQGFIVLNNVGALVSNSTTSSAIGAAAIQQVNQRIDELAGSFNTGRQQIENRTMTAINGVNQYVQGEISRIYQTINSQASSLQYSLSNITSAVNQTNTQCFALSTFLTTAIQTIQIQTQTSFDSFNDTITSNIGSISNRLARVERVTNLFQQSDVNGTEVKLITGLAISGNLSVTGNISP